MLPRPYPCPHRTSRRSSLPFTSCLYSTPSLPTTVTTAVPMVNTANAVYEFRPDGGTVSTTRDIVKLASCSTCHDGKVLAHGSRKDPQYCVTCHNQRLKTAKLELDTLDLAHPEHDALAWERAIRKLRAGMMPPVGKDRPSYDTMQALAEGDLSSPTEGFRAIVERSAGADAERGLALATAIAATRDLVNTPAEHMGPADLAAAAKALAKVPLPQLL